ncbi:MAG: hypothetical protein B7O98_01460 [Zestosphaera tikiterensis]|uniref:Exonuclease n=1 Tax=Zestosphaera tikiterensis TaxID=1973259 RepID=A0A2R7Y6K8_9CREN|nr:MAG: hypothetical protein B7O98_01460 [Zestosphaera tikiterensis]
MGGVGSGLEFLVVLNNVNSPSRLVDFVKVALSNNKVKIAAVVASRVSGMAAQTGVPEASKYAIKKNKAFFVLPTLQEVIELLKPDKVYIVVNSEVAKSLTEVKGEINGRVMLVFNGVEGSLSKSELALGEHIRIEDYEETPPAPVSLAIVLRELTKTT